MKPEGVHVGACGDVDALRSNVGLDSFVVDQDAEGGNLTLPVGNVTRTCSRNQWLLLYKAKPWKALFI